MMGGFDEGGGGVFSWISEARVTVDVCGMTRD